jgi:hypothetical protein
VKIGAIGKQIGRQLSPLLGDKSEIAGCGYQGCSAINAFQLSHNTRHLQPRGCSPEARSKPKDHGIDAALETVKDFQHPSAFVA